MQFLDFIDGRVIHPLSDPGYREGERGFAGFRWELEIPVFPPFVFLDVINLFLSPPPKLELKNGAGRGKKSVCKQSKLASKRTKNAILRVKTSLSSPPGIQYEAAR